MIRNIQIFHSWLNFDDFFYQKIGKNTNRPSYTIVTYLADFTDFDQIFQLFQFVPRTLPILTEYIVLYRLNYI
jgi:hypothetical protein